MYLGWASLDRLGSPSVTGWSEGEARSEGWRRGVARSDFWRAGAGRPAEPRDEFSLLVTEEFSRDGVLEVRPGELCFESADFICVGRTNIPWFSGQEK
jgi:hypothetical protein